MAAQTPLDPIGQALVGGRWPMGYLATHGPRADPVTPLTWGFIALSVAVMAIMTLAVVVGVIVRHQRRAVDLQSAAVGPDRGGYTWFYVGLPLTVLALAIMLVWTLRALAQVDSPAQRPTLTIEVSGHQWWWGVRYLAGPGAAPLVFDTANEIHVPVGQPVMLRLIGADVIHSFWIPALTGKTDTIPSRINVAWLQADRPGVYRGQCTEYCGLQHAHMAAYVIAEPPAQFQAWRLAQAAPAAAPPAGLAQVGEGVFVAHCGACHTVRGTPAGGLMGPDLTHLMSRRTIAAGVAPNSPNALSGWILDPQSMKPGSRMPPTALSGVQLAQVRAYLETLR